MKLSKKKSMLKIISGKYKSRKIVFNTFNNKIRPTSSRMRETLFNWLMPYIKDAYCLDAFSGSGILGIEALSRYAARCDFVDINKTACCYLKKNIYVLDLHKKSNVICNNIFNHLKKKIITILFFLTLHLKVQFLRRLLIIIVILKNILLYI